MYPLFDTGTPRYSRARQLPLNYQLIITPARQGRNTDTGVVNRLLV